MAAGIRIDQALVNRGLAEDLETARRLVMAGEVYSRGQLIHHPSTRIPEEAELSIDRGPRFVSRGGEKLAAALQKFSLSVTGLICGDVGSSTGGFTDCLLQYGAARVYAVDVGYGVLEWSLRKDPRVEVMERTNARYLNELPEPVEFVSVDVSFISLHVLLPVIRRWFSAPGGDLVALIKPQFEATRAEAARGSGVIHDPEVHRRVLQEVITGAGPAGYRVQGVMASPLRGQQGNREFLAWLETSEPHQATRDPDRWIDDLVED